MLSPFRQRALQAPNTNYKKKRDGALTSDLRMGRKISKRGLEAERKQLNTKKAGRREKRWKSRKTNQKKQSQRLNRLKKKDHKKQTES